MACECLDVSDFPVFILIYSLLTPVCSDNFLMVISSPAHDGDFLTSTHLLEAAEHLPQLLLPFCQLASAAEVTPEVGSQGIHDQEFERLLLFTNANTSEWKVSA